MPQGQSTAPPGAWGVPHPHGARGAGLRKTTNAEGQSQSEWVAGGPKQPSTETKVAWRAARSMGGTALGLWPVSHSTAKLTANGSSNPQAHFNTPPKRKAKACQPHVLQSQTTASLGTGGRTAGSRVGPGPATSATGHKPSPLPTTPPLGSIQSKRQLVTQQARLEDRRASLKGFSWGNGDN